MATLNANVYLLYFVIAIFALHITMASAKCKNCIGERKAQGFLWYPPWRFFASLVRLAD
jgi:hypothetical protein